MTTGETALPMLPPARPQAAEDVVQWVAWAQTTFPSWRPTIPVDGGWCGTRLTPTTPTEGYAPLVDPTHPVLQHAKMILALWPEMLVQVEALCDTITAGTPSDTPVMEATGGTCGPVEAPGHILVVANNPVGFAEGVVHEVGHHKLRMLGVEMETHTGRVIHNDPAAVYESGVRKDRLRPMSACLQAHYSYLHVTELELRAHALGAYSVEQMLCYQPKRLREGLTTLGQCVWAPSAVTFGAEVLDWTHDLLARLTRAGITEEGAT